MMRNTPPPTASQPRSGWKTKIAATKTGGEGDVEDRHQHGRGPKPLHCFKIALGSKADGVGGHKGQPLHRGGENPAVQLVLHGSANAGHDAAAHMVQKAHGEKEEGDQQATGRPVSPRTGCPARGHRPEACKADPVSIRILTRTEKIPTAQNRPRLIGPRGPQLGITPSELILRHASPCLLPARARKRRRKMSCVTCQPRLAVVLDRAATYPLPSPAPVYASLYSAGT